MLIALKLLYAALTILLAGRIIFEVPALKLNDEPAGIRIPIYFAAGSIVISLYMFILFTLNIKYSILSISAPFIAYFAYYCYAYSRFFPEIQIKTRTYLINMLTDPFTRSNSFYIAALSCLTMLLITVFIQNLITPIFIGDVYCMWFFKAKAAFTCNTLPREIFTNLHYLYTTFTYPLLTSLNVAWISLCLGQWSDTVPKTFYSLLYLSTMVFFYYSLKPLSGKKLAMIGTFISFSIPHVIGDITTGYVDLNVAFFGFFSLVLLYKWMEDRSKQNYLLLSGLFVGGAAWTHNEGLMLFAALLLTLSTFVIAQYLKKNLSLKAAAINIIAFCAFYGLVTTPFKIFITINDLKQIWVSSFWQLFQFLPNMWRIPVITRYVLYELFLNTYLWLYFWIFAMVMIYINRKRILATNLRYILLFILFSFAMIFEVFFVSSPLVSADAWETLIQQNLDRAMLLIPFAAGFLIFASSASEDN